MPFRPESITPGSRDTAEPMHLVARLGEFLLHRIGGVEDFVFRVGVGMIQRAGSDR